MSEKLIQESEAIKSGIHGIRNNVKTLEAQYKQALFAITPDQANKSSAQIQTLTDETSTQIHKVKGQIDDFKRAIINSPEASVRQTMSESLTQKFADVLQQYQKSQTEYKDKVKTRMAQKVKIVKPDATEDEVEQAIETGEADKLYRQGTLDQQSLHSQAKNALSYIQDRHREIVQIEQSINELHDMFVDMAVLVQSQGVVLDIVQENVDSAILTTRDGTDQMRDALVKQKTSRKKMYILLVILVIVVVGLLLGGILGALSSKTNA